MSTVTKSIAAGDFKARCLSLLDEVARTRLPLVVTKRGKPVARLVPVTDEPAVSLLGSAKYRSESDLLAPIDESWDADR
jgi:prevent-host-death family protein